MRNTALAIAITLLAAATAFCGNPRKERRTLARADELVAQQKYLSAYRLLDRYDPRNEVADIVLKKTDIVLNYYVVNMMGQIFALKDIPEGRSLLDYRGKEGISDCFFFSADTVLMRLAAHDSTDCRIFRALGRYYTLMQRMYGESWLNGDELQLLHWSLQNYSKAETLGCSDTTMFYDMAMASLLQGEAADATTYFDKALSLGSTHNADLHYNLAYACLESDRPKALQNAVAASALYSDTVLKADAERMAGYICALDGNHRKAIRHLELSDSLCPNFDTWGHLLSSYIKVKSPKTLPTTEKIFNVAPGNPSGTDRLIRIYFQSDTSQIPQLLWFFNGKLLQAPDSATSANLHFSIGTIHFTQNRRNEAKPHLLKAQETYSTLLENDDELLAVLREMLLRCK